MKGKRSVVQHGNDSDPTLSSLPVLLMDCQTTGAAPTSGHLLEVAWSSGTAARPLEKVESHLCRLPEGVTIPPAVGRVTGIEAADLGTADPPIRVRRRLRCAISKPCCGIRPVMAVIHYARFERPFLDRWFDSGGCGRRFPLRILCTHEISRRLYPDLPRRGIRALAGYFGRPLPGLRRSADHVAATWVIWQEVVEALASRKQITTLGALLRWLQNTPVPPRDSLVFPMPASVRSNLPEGPGVYRMRRKNGDLLYVGKAKSIKRRVAQYFHRTKGRAEHVLEMLTQAAAVEAHETETALEAALQESDEIKHSQPPYNKALRSDDRTVWFTTLDFRHGSHRPDRDHCVGPIPDARWLFSLRIMAEWIGGKTSPEGHGGDLSPAALFPWHQQWTFRESVWQKGLSLFMARNNLLRSQSRSLLTRLVDLGHRLWCKRFTEAADARPSDSDNAGTAVGASAGKHNDGKEALSPATVAENLEGILRHAAHRVRRARWFCLLSESSLCWTARNRGNKDRHGWIIRCAGLNERLPVGEHRMPPIPPGWQKGCRIRQQNFDVSAYDRMRVLTTEIRRLVAENRTVALRCGPAHLLETDALADALEWL